MILADESNDKKDESNETAERVRAYLLGRDRWRLDELLRDVGLDNDGPSRLLVWHVEQALRADDGVEFVPSRVPGEYALATPEQRVRRATRFAAAARRKVHRSLAILDACPEPKDADMARRLESARHKIEDQIMAAEIRARAERKPKPPGI